MNHCFILEPPLFSGQTAMKNWKTSDHWWKCSITQSSPVLQWPGTINKLQHLQVLMFSVRQVFFKVSRKTECLKSLSKCVESMCLKYSKVSKYVWKFNAWIHGASINPSSLELRWWDRSISGLVLQIRVPDIVESRRRISKDAIIDIYIYISYI